LHYEVTKQVFIIIIINVDIVHKVNVKGSFKGFLQWMKIYVYGKYIYMCVLPVTKWRKTARWRTRTRSFF